MYGFLKNCASCSILNHLILIGKYFLYSKVSSNVKPRFADFKTLLLEKIKLERYIAIMSNFQPSVITMFRSIDLKGEMSQK